MSCTFCLSYGMRTIPFCVPKWIRTPNRAKAYAFCISF